MSLTQNQKTIKALMKKHGHTESQGDFDSLDQFSAGDKVDAILNYKRNSNPEFDSKFVESVNLRLLERGNISFKQEESLNRIINKFNIDMDRNL